jgi:hypothetical protein
MDLQTTDRLYGNTATSLFDRRDTTARDDAGRSEAFRSFLKDAEARRTEERHSASRRDDAAAADRDPVRDDRDARRADTKPKNTEAASETRPAKRALAGDAAAPAEGRPQKQADSATGTVQDGANDTKATPQDVASAERQDASAPAATDAADMPEMPETVPAPVAVSDAPAETPVDTTVEAAPAVQVPPVAADPAGQKKTKAAAAVGQGNEAQANANQANTNQADAAAKTAAKTAAKAAQAAASAGDPALSGTADTAVDAGSGDVTTQTVQKTAQNAPVPTTVEGEAKAQPTEAQSADARPAGTPPVQSQPAQQGMPILAQNGAATAAGASSPALTGDPTEPGLESLAADAGRGARNPGEAAAPAASGQGTGGTVPAGAASSGGAQANAGGEGNGQSAGQNAAAKQPQQAAGADQPGMNRSATNESFNSLLARAQGDAPGADPMAAGTARPGEGAVVTPTASGSPGTQAAAAAAAQASAPAAPRPPMPVSNQVAIQLHNAAKDDVRKMTIHLRPEAMGKVEVSMEVDQAGRLQAVISADKAEALDWLRRDAHHLERALQDAGMKMDQQSLSFNLRGDGQSGGGSDGKGSGGRGGVLGQGDEMVEAPADGIVRRLDALIDVSV